MPSPFPGMDPYIERPAIWPDFHDCLVAAIRGTLQPLLRPKYAALTQDRLYLVESERPIYPDVAIVTPDWAMHKPSGGSGAAVLEADAPAVQECELDGEQLREPFIEIIEPAAGGRVVTAIEVISPSNKDVIAGRAAYLTKRQEYLGSGAHLVEIDLLRLGRTLVHASDKLLTGVCPYDYVVAITRRLPTRKLSSEVYAFGLEQRLPRIAIPLAHEDPDVVLDLNAPFTRCWDEGPYPMLLKYDEAPMGELSPERLAWCRQRLVDAGFLTAQ